jgi:hypothetical protein
VRHRVIRKLAAADDGYIHNDSVTKKITVLVYLNRTWEQAGGRLRILRSEKDIDDYAVEVNPCGGTVLAFRRNERSFHGFTPLRRRAHDGADVLGRSKACRTRRKEESCKFVKRLIRKRG